ncbi:mitochondrial ATPase inhibitor, IATP family protein [Myxozyma melibiosi]|uniref:ATPase inhibitor, mitochondrial n=1 Tax=Myxozyma melibiosi TaxID=54550 RepID=A0ABR1F956_9ASCO
MISSVSRIAARRAPVARLFARAYSSEGATGSVRPGGEKSGDSFQKREAAQENLYVRQVEAEKLKALREALKKQREHLDTIENHLNDLEKK